MSTCFSRSGLIVKEETPSSYLPVFTPSTRESNGAFCISTSRPSTCPTARARSTSKPTMVVPSASMNWLGAYDASVPMVSLPSEATSAGTMAASAASLAALGAALTVASPEVSVSLLEQADSPTHSETAPRRAIGRMRIFMNLPLPTLVAGPRWSRACTGECSHAPFPRGCQPEGLATDPAT